ncbi:hypothetical protein ACFV2Q_16040 [Streptomyces sp. NPDC059650]
MTELSDLPELAQWNVTPATATTDADGMAHITSAERGGIYRGHDKPL